MIQHNAPTLGIEEERAALRAIRSGWLAQGPEVESFEDGFCKFISLPVGHAVAVSSGTSALFLSLWVLNAKGKNISFPVYACSALRHAIEMAECHELPLDIDDNSPNIELDQLRTYGKDITIVPHMYGIPIDLSDFHELNIIEDCAQALGAKVNGKFVGLQGTIGIFSFYATKLITSGGQGGMIVSKDKILIDKIRDYREFDYRRDNKRRFNFQMTDLQAAIGREQLKKLPRFLARRSEIFDQYKGTGLDLLDIKAHYKSKLLPVRCRAIVRTMTPHKLINSLKSVGVQARVPTEDWALLGEPQLFPNALRLTKETVSLPIYPSLSDDDIETILKGMK